MFIQVVDSHCSKDVLAVQTDHSLHQDLQRAMQCHLECSTLTFYTQLRRVCFIRCLCTHVSRTTP